MSSPYQRRRDPQPVGRGWEVAVAVIGAVLLGAGLAALGGLGAASLLFGGGWVWPHGTDTIGQVIGGLLTGDPGHGLPPAQRRRVASPAAVYACVVAAESALITTGCAAGVVFCRYRRPGDARGGMATRREAEHVLGMSVLSRARPIIRPDLYGAGREGGGGRAP